MGHGQGAPGGYDVVMVCAGPCCAPRAEDLVSAVSPVVRSAPCSLLLRTECHGTCHHGPGVECSVLVQQVDPAMRPRGPARRLDEGPASTVQGRVARWLLRAT